MANLKSLSNVGLAYPIERLSRKLALRRETCTYEDKYAGLQWGVAGSGKKVRFGGNTYLGVSSRTVNLINVGKEVRNTLFMRKPFEMPVATANQIAAKANFGLGNSWVADANKDMMAVVANQETFLAARDAHTPIYGVLPDGYQSMTGWMRAIAIKVVTDGGTLPQDHKLASITNP